MALLRIVRIGGHIFRVGINGDPLPCAGRALFEIPLIFKQQPQKAVVPLYRRRCPCALKAAAYRVGPFAASVAVFPARSLLFERSGFRLRPHILLRIGRAVAFAERMAAYYKCDRLFVVHAHTPEALAYIFRRRKNIRFTVGPLRVDINKPHLNGGKRFFHFTLATVAFVAQPLRLGAPVDILFRLPDIYAAAAETESFKPHILQCDIPRQNHQVGPRDLLSIFSLYGPKQAAGLVEVDVVGPAVYRCKALISGASAAAAVEDAVCAGAVPCHTDKKGTVMAVVGRPPLLRLSQNVPKILFESFKIELRKLFCVVEPIVRRLQR